ncbi:MAG: hypothetical protein JXC36_02365 [Candidatus Atribacteria bacterium]|nr:hypothetical protein [Candidatus Atribacteria bacterium]
MKKIFILIVSALILGLLFTGCGDIVKISSPATVNTDGDLYKCDCVQSDTATGLGTPIKPKGTWFMYNSYGYSDDVNTYPGYPEYPEDGGYWIVAGNPKNGPTVMGEYYINNNLDGSYTATYWIDDTFEVVDEHLGISNNPDFTAKPGKDDNQDFGVPFYDDDGKFYIFAHFAVECK